MRFGLSFPNFGSYAEPDVLVTLAVAAELGGWEGFFVWDHIVISDGMPVADPWVLLGAIGQSTTSILLGPMVAAVPRHRPWVVARQAVTIDRLTGGRMVLGVGIGFPPEVEFGTFGDPVDDRTRADMLDEGLTIITGVWSGQPFEFESDHYTVRKNTFRPYMVQSPRIPIWVAGTLPHRRPWRRAARFDGVFPIRSDMEDMTPTDLREVLTHIRHWRTVEEAFDVVVGGPPDGDVAALEEAGATWYLAGPRPTGESIEETLAWVGAGPPAPV